MSHVVILIRTNKHVFSAIFIFTLFSLKAFCQEFSDTSMIKTLFNQKFEPRDFSSGFKNAETEIKISLSASFIIYKKFISSQDIDACRFNPSCSEYLMEAVEKKGLPGMLDGFDRLLRCHPFVGKNDYPHVSNTSKFHDPF
jgi:uncharacterized protein